MQSCLGAKMKKMLLAGLLASTALSAYAADIKVETAIPGFGSAVFINGTITPEDSENFKLRTNQLSGKVSVYLNSTGGNLVAALEIGETIRLKGWSTYVVSECYSGCALIWLAGVRRVMYTDAKIGFHAASINGEEKGVGNALLGTYLARLGFGYGVAALVTQSDPNNITILTPEIAKQAGIELDLLQRQDQPVISPSPKVAVIYVPRKDWDSFIPSSGRYIHRYLYAGTDGTLKLMAVDHDKDGGTAGNSVCIFKVDGWSDCIGNTGNHYQLKAASIKSFANIAATAPQLDPNSTEAAWFAQYVERWSKGKPYFDQVRMDMAKLLEAGQVPLLPNGLFDLDQLYAKAMAAKYPWTTPPPRQ